MTPPTEGARIIVKRSLRLPGAARRLELAVDDEHVGDLQVGQTIAVPVTPGPHEFMVRFGATRFAARSKPLTLNLRDGDEVVVTCTPKFELEYPDFPVPKLGYLLFPLLLVPRWNRVNPEMVALQTENASRS